MQFDDRLATVLRHRAASERGASTQYRQLVDLLGGQSGAADESMLATAYLRLGALAESVPAAQRAAILSDPATRLRNSRLVARLAEDEPAVATAALSAARLTETEWLGLIPSLPIRARGLLRHRRDLPEDVSQLLSQLGVGDNVLPQPDGYEPVPEVIAAPAPAPVPTPTPKRVSADQSSSTTELAAKDAIIDDLPPEAASGIGALVERIEAFRQTKLRPAKRLGDDDPVLPLNLEDIERATIVTSFDFSVDGDGRIDWASAAVAPAMVGHRFARDAQIRTALRRRLTMSGATASLEDVPLLGGNWHIDAAPRFADFGGRFLGHVGRARRIIERAETEERQDDNPQAERVRQMLHELRTPVNAIQGFAEVIQQQLFGPTPHEYRALAATIAGDAARMLAGFEELDRLARLESDSLDLEDGQADLAALMIKTVDQLSGLLTPKMSEFAMHGVEVPCLVPMAQAEAEGTVWRLIATLASSVAAGEVIALEMVKADDTVQVDIDLPARMLDRDNIFEASVRDESSAVSSGMFGAGFSLRLARAEITAAGGALVRAGDRIRLTLPLLRSPPLTGDEAGHSEGSGAAG